PSGRPGGYYDQLVGWARGTGADGVRHLDRPEVRRGLAEIFVVVRLNELLNWQVSAMGENPSMGDSAASKVSPPSRSSASDGSPRNCWAASATPPTPPPPRCSAGST